MLNQKPELSIIIPSYLEEENLRILLPRLNNVLLSLPKISFVILVIDTMEPMDNTKQVCQENNIMYINREIGNSFGNAIRTGIKKAKSKYIIFMDGDGSHSPEFIPNLIKYKEDYDVIIASRYVEGGATDNSKILIFMSKVVNVFYSFFLNLKCKDVSNGFRLYKSYLFRNLNLNSDNFDIIEEILFKMNKNKKDLKIKEIPYIFKERMFGHTKRNLIIFAISFFFTLIKLKFRK